ncbi:branched-chain amino acid ABC transporter permease [Capillimicrobium parvum]|uniref:branched-chain amino acid ABC transporter permease n=1 Tax=Capillimicrobium parvum TaxID=2884022 RepID=UPI00216B4DE4|nr:branched-chain amino acid ABC transporter permease [Capillimicrobium parvum]
MATLQRGIRLTWTPLVLSVVVVVTWVLIESGGDIFYEREGEKMFLRLMLVLGLQMFSGNSGVMSFGHVAFMAVGAYASALLTIPTEIKEITFTEMPSFLSSWIFPAQFGPLAGTLVAALVAALLAAIFAFPIVRLSGIAAAIATLAVLVITNVFISQTPALTLGSDTINGVPQTATLGATVVWVVLTIFLAYGLKQSRIGLRLRASRENENAAKSVGVGVRRERYVAFVLAGFVFGIAGALYAHYFVGFSYTDFYFDLTFIVVAMLVVGGLGSVTGAVVGTFFLTVVYVAVQRIEVNGVLGAQPPSGTANLVLAVVLLGALIIRPNGLTGGREVPLPSWLSRDRGNGKAIIGEHGDAVLRPSSSASV